MDSPQKALGKPGRQLQPLFPHPQALSFYYCKGNAVGQAQFTFAPAI